MSISRVAMGDSKKFVACNYKTIDDLRRHIVKAKLLLDQYRWIADAYVSDFFVHKFWTNLPRNWTQYLGTVSPPEISFLLKLDGNNLSQVPPLSLLAFRMCVLSLSLRRCPVDLDDVQQVQEILTALKPEQKDQANDPPDGHSRNQESGQSKESHQPGDKSDENSDQLDVPPVDQQSKDDLNQKTKDHQSYQSKTLQHDHQSSKSICVIEKSEDQRSGDQHKQESNQSKELQDNQLIDHCPHSDHQSSLKKGDSNGIKFCEGDTRHSEREEWRGVMKNGQWMELEHVYRKHVKPKKQHEIQKLSQTISYLCCQSGSSQVVDVGAGLGHLSRLLTFCHGVKVTTVEASGGHAPKATKFDRETKKDIKKARNKKLKLDKPGAAEVCDDLAVNLPSHVSCMIHPNISTSSFLELIRESRIKQQQMDTEEQTVSGGHLVKTSQMNVDCNKSNLINGCDIKDHQEIDSMFHEKFSECQLCKTTGHEKEKCNDVSDNTSQRFCKCECSNTVMSNQTDSTDVDESPDTVTMNNKQDMNTETLGDKDEFVVSGDKDEFVVSGDKDEFVVAGDKDEFVVSGDKDEFVVSGLHACGDLTPTLIHLFVNCDAAVGLASVGCCYMKLTQERAESTDSGYPMSQFVRGLPNSDLTYSSRELACHFADAYIQRLQDNPRHLKIHSYRAALQHIIVSLLPDFKHGAMKLTIKNATEKSFEEYAKIALQKLGYEAEIPSQLLAQAESYLPLWKDVVAFYTLRLSLAPVVETIILLDRMLYLSEQGIPNVLVPIFDPKLSPRNFVLLGMKGNM